ncbi:hypothetical protein CEXT_13841, partial [Caerostris extrusa]
INQYQQRQCYDICRMGLQRGVVIVDVASFEAATELGAYDEEHENRRRGRISSPNLSFRRITFLVTTSW